MADFGQRIRRQMRDELIGAAYDAMLAGGYAGLRMGDIASRTGVSRQTVYNEFGDKWGLLQAVAERETERFLVEINQALTEHPDPIDGLRASVDRALTLASENALVKAALSAPGSDQASQLLTTRGEPLLQLCHQSLDAYVRSHWPHMSASDATTGVDLVLRVVLSHIVLPTEPPAVVADRVTRVLGPFLREADA